MPRLAQEHGCLMDALERTFVQDENGWSWDSRTAEAVKEIVRYAHRHGTRINVTYADENKWPIIGLNSQLNEGYVGLTMGPNRVPMLIRDTRCRGGNPIWDWKIVKIRASRGKRVLYVDPDYQGQEAHIWVRRTKFGGLFEVAVGYDSSFRWRQMGDLAYIKRWASRTDLKWDGEVLPRGCEIPWETC